MRRDLLQFFYLASAILFVMGLRGLSHPRTARRGMFLAELGMLLAIIGSLLHHEIIDYRFIAAGLVLGTLIGAPMAIWIPMTAVPQRTALSHSFGALAAALIGISEYYRHGAAHMPVVIALLNSYAGLTDAAMGFMLDNKIQIITGSLDGSSGFILSILMCRAMNRSITNVLFGAFGKVQEKPAELEGKKPIRQTTVDEA